MRANTAFESTLTNGTVTCEPDVVLRTGTNAIYCEFKSWSNFSGEENADDKESDPNYGSFPFLRTGYIPSDPSKTSSYKQFRAYLSQIPSLDNLRYYFDARKLAEPSMQEKRDFVKGVFQTLFQNKTNEIFEVIWGNVNGLPQSLFGNRLKPAAEIYFRDVLVPNLSSDLYTFIKIK